MSQSSLYKSIYRSEIDGLRAFAVLSVVTFHLFPSLLKGGFIGVDVFFVISGFLITSHIFENLDKGQFSFIDFFGRRIRRIFPALILVMSSSLAFGWFTLLADEFSQLGKHVASGVAFMINLILVDESGYFDNITTSKPMLHLWSLAVEEQFYIVWPFVLWLAWKRKFNLLTITILVAVASFYWNLRFVKSDPTETFFWPLGRFWELLTGSVLAWLFLYKFEIICKFKLWIDKFLVRIINLKEVEANGSIASNLMSIFGLSLLTYGVIRINESLTFPSKWALVPVLGAVLVIASGSKAWLNRVLLMNPIAVWFGLISYPLYLWHWPILSFLYIVYGETPHIDSRILAILLSILLAWLTYSFIEKPIRFGSKKGTKSVVLVSLILLVGAIGLHINNNGGNTPYNLKLKYVSDAKGDWEYPNGLHKRDMARVFYTSDKQTEVIFLGDSHIEQYSPRVVNLYQKGLAKEIAFITSGGCPPIPNVYEDSKKNCLRLLEKFKNVLSSNDIKTIVIGASFYRDFKRVHSKGTKNQYYFKDGDVREPYYRNGQRLAKESFYKFITHLSQGYKVVVILDNPQDYRFNPNTLLKSISGKRPIPLGIDVNYSSFRMATDQVQLNEEMRQKLFEMNIEFVDPTKLICPNSLCSSINDKGEPLYKDNSHMRPFFVKEHMTILDPFILK